MDLFIIENGKLVDLMLFDEETVNSLRESIYSVLPKHLHFVIVSDYGMITGYSFEEYIKYSDKPLRIYPNSTEQRKWGDSVILYLRRNKIEISKFTNIGCYLGKKLNKKRFNYHHEEFEKFHKQKKEHDKKNKIQTTKYKQLKLTNYIY